MKSLALLISSSPCFYIHHAGIYQFFRSIGSRSKAMQITAPVPMAVFICDEPNPPSSGPGSMGRGWPGGVRASHADSHAAAGHLEQTDLGPLENIISGMSGDSVSIPVLTASQKIKFRMLRMRYRTKFLWFRAGKQTRIWMKSTS